MKFNFSSWDLGGKLIFISTCLAFISFFFKWVEFAFFSENGFAQGAVFFILVFIYPLLMVLLEKPLNKIAGYICGGLGVLLGLIYIFSKSADFFGQSINAASTGPYVFIISSLILIFGVKKRSM
jgi:hypothetical protein